MFAITGITGQVGGVVARQLLGRKKSVRAVVRDAAKGALWAAQGCDLALATMEDGAALERAFTGMEGVFILLPPTFDPSAGYPEARAAIASIRTALLAAKPGKVVCLSTIGARATQANLLNQLGLLEEALSDLPMPVAFLRAGWFMENAIWDVAPARDGMIPSYLQPLDKPVPMVATADVGSVAAELLLEEWSGVRVVELEGPQRVTPLDIAACFGKLLGREVKTEAVPRFTWADVFRSHGMRNPLPRMQMLDGFNEGWINFESGRDGTRKGVVGLETVLQGLISRA
ncbi:putative nucleoside-diphosphate sugar epimerase [Herbaspirillum sp. CF444]|uniref:NmrA family NAD(P)-binding protein n=1 Tax=Herbaspirillum sp. CF444 TaxID=1144319 RepID=UPI0002723982|nr:NmrA family NAD(P)-binding protein [Herbaspirillum sp. CF444]EJL94411.1 putative nucleoside-diphosphate sugar epimerase [Herbaspirillum sp. CF444]